MHGGHDGIDAVWVDELEGEPAPGAFDCVAGDELVFSDAEEGVCALEGDGSDDYFEVDVSDREWFHQLPIVHSGFPGSKPVGDGAGAADDGAGAAGDDEPDGSALAGRKRRRSFDDADRKPDWATRLSSWYRTALDALVGPIVERWRPLIETEVWRVLGDGLLLPGLILVQLSDIDLGTPTSPKMLEQMTASIWAYSDLIMGTMAGEVRFVPFSLLTGELAHTLHSLGDRTTHQALVGGSAAYLLGGVPAPGAPVSFPVLVVFPQKYRDPISMTEFGSDLGIHDILAGLDSRVCVDYQEPPCDHSALRGFASDRPAVDSGLCACLARLQELAPVIPVSRGVMYVSMLELQTPDAATARALALEVIQAAQAVVDAADRQAAAESEALMARRNADDAARAAEAAEAVAAYEAAYGAARMDGAAGAAADAPETAAMDVAGGSADDGAARMDE